MAQSVDNLLDQVRTQLDETNTANATDAQLLQALNRAQRAATNIVAREYDSMFWSSTSTTTVASQREYDIPVDAYGRRVEMVEIEAGGVRYELRRIGNNKTTQFTQSSQVQRPTYYSIVKNKIALFPLPAGGTTLYIHYNKRAENLVSSQGRITATGSTYVTVDSLGSSLAVATTGFGSYVNVIDYNTGEIKGTLQISAIDTALKKVSFKTSGLTRSTVLGRTINTSLPTDIAVDDYISLVTGTAVSELDEAYTDYLVQYAVVEIRRRFGETIQEELIALQTLEKEIERMWVGRESSKKIRKSNSHYHSLSTRRMIT
jgi:hypothetical protein